MNNFYLAEPQQMISLTPKKQQKEVAGKTLKFIDKECNPKQARFPRKQVLEKAFHKNAKTCRAGFHKKPTKQDGTHMTIRSQITIPTSIFPTTHTTISPAYTYHPYSITHTTQHTVATTHSPSQLHLLYTQNSLNAHHKLLPQGFF